MASINMQLNMTRLRDSIALYGHAMPFGLEHGCVSDGIGICHIPSPVTFVFAQAPSVPISRGSPPTPD